MNMSDIELKLLAAEPVEIARCGCIHIPTVREVIKMDESKYNQYLSLLLLDKDSMDEEVDEKYSSFDIIFANCFHSEEFRSMYFDAIEVVFKKRPQMCDVKTSIDAFFYFEDDGRIHKDNYGQIQEIISVGNHVKKTRDKKDFNPANDQAKKFMEKLMYFRKNTNIKKKEEITLHSMVNGMAWKSNNVNILNIFDLTVYQLREGFFSLTNIDDYQYTLHGIYAGTVDMKKIKFDRLQWAKIIEQK